jgi:hypothetical protein
VPRGAPYERATANIINNNTESAYGYGDLHIGPGLIPELPRRVIKIIYEEIRIRSARGPERESERAPRFARISLSRPTNALIPRSSLTG